MNFQVKDRYDIIDLIRIMEILRSKDGCPWDREQTHQTIRNNFIEETYEVIEAIDNNDIYLLREELGDVLLQVVFHSQIEMEQENFDFSDVASDICKKLIVRHPHIFDDAVLKTADEVLDRWETIKKETKRQTTYTQTLKAVPIQLPALMRAKKVQSRAKKAGFCYPNVQMAIDDLKSEIAELEQAIKNNDISNIDEEIGDVLFSAVNVSRLLDCEGEQMLSKSTDKFIKRFEFVEKFATEENINLQEADIDTLNKLWIKAKE